MMKVIKLGGSLLEDSTRRAQALQSIAEAWSAGDQIVLVHGGGKHIDGWLTRLGIPKRTHAGLRVTDDETLPVVVGVLAGIVNKMLVAELTQLGVKAAGISGADASTLCAARYPLTGDVDLGNVGQVSSSDPTLIQGLLLQGILPVVSSVAISEAGALLNVNADSAASAIAIAVRAKSLVFITDVAGLLDADGAIVPTITPRKAKLLVKSDVVSGGMKPKLEAALHAMHAGVASVSIGEGTQIVARLGDRGSRTAENEHVAA
jgi:acetylglutamate kinase